MTNTTFWHVTITIPTEPRAAYTALCDALAAIGADWHTMEYSVDDGEPRSTNDLFLEE